MTACGEVWPPWKQQLPASAASRRSYQEHSAPYRECMYIAPFLEGEWDCNAFDALRMRTLMCVILRAQAALSFVGTQRCSCLWFVMTGCVCAQLH